MTPKEKAKELYEKMLFCYQGHIDEYTARQCALIAVDEIISIQVVKNGYWQQVKQEIEVL